MSLFHRHLKRVYLFFILFEVTKRVFTSDSKESVGNRVVTSAYITTYKLKELIISNINYK